MKRVGVLALQGDVREHVAILRELDAATVAVKTVEDLETVDAIVLPGGESTTIGLLLEKFDLLEPLRKRIEDGMPALGTCAGAILLANKVIDGDVPKLGLLDATVRRNAYGSQVDSFEADIELRGEPLHAVFIRAPVIEETGPDVDVLAECRDKPVVVRQGDILAATFHPELIGETRLHKLLVEAMR